MSCPLRREITPLGRLGGRGEGWAQLWSSCRRWRFTYGGARARRRCSRVSAENKGKEFAIRRMKQGIVVRSWARPRPFCF